MKTTVADLIAFLQTQPSNMRVVLDGYEGGLCDLRLPEAANQIPIRLNINSQWYYGNHEESSADEADEIALHLERSDEELKPTNNA